MADYHIGKCKVSIEAHGCVSCGTGHSHAWIKIKDVEVRIGGIVRLLPVFKCGHCVIREGGQMVLTPEPKA